LRKSAGKSAGGDISKAAFQCELKEELCMKISVCMATFNGAEYIKVQLGSILKQLGPGDQIVVVDDASKDNTVEIVNSFNDPRIHLFINEFNMGPARTFDRALHQTQGDLIFLSDQDDRWYDNKVSVVVDTFSKQDVDLIVHDAAIVRGNYIIEKSLFERSRSSAGIFKNIKRNTYTGCCMAFRKSVLAKVLPISSRIGLFHDAWIGVLAEFFGFRVAFIEVPLMEFIRHDRNASTLKRRSMFRILYDRLRFVSAMAIHVIRVNFKIFD
jgi:glycosyltransferase involved in cell wall biosynthesis